MANNLANDILQLMPDNRNNNNNNNWHPRPALEPLWHDPLEKHSANWLLKALHYGLL